MTDREIFDYQAGREARIKGAPRDRRRNVAWQRGWDDVQNDYDNEDENLYFSGHVKGEADARAELERLRETIAELVEIAMPFVKHLAYLDKLYSQALDSNIVASFAENHLTYGDFRRISAAVNRATEAGK